MATNAALARRRRALVPVLVAVLALVAACGGGDEEATRRTTTTPAPTTTAAPSAPLTGVPEADPARLARPAIIVKVDNTNKGFPLQEGVDKADLVFVEQTEGGTTRLAAVFQSQDAVVGPVRSARSSDVAIAGLLNRPLLSYSGANDGVLGQVRQGPLVDVGIDAAGVTDVYQRNQRGGTRNLYRYFLPITELYAAKGGDGGTPPALFTYRAADAEPAGDPARGVRVGYGGGAPTTVVYEWDEGLGGWARTQNEKAHVMAGGGPRIAPANVVVLITPYRDSGFSDATGAASPEAVLEGSGEAWFLSGGKVVKGTWNRPAPDAPMTFAGPNGQPPALTPGQTWIELAPGAGSASLL